jgi:hypothetical protein
VGFAPKVLGFAQAGQPFDAPPERGLLMAYGRLNPNPEYAIVRSAAGNCFVKVRLSIQVGSVLIATFRSAS